MSVSLTMSSLQKDLPYYAEGTVVSGFGRGGKELGIPTANFPDDVVQCLPASFECGVYYGWAKLKSEDSVRRMVMSIGWNPYYKNTVKTMEIHIMHKFDHDFYGDCLKVIVLGYIRPMCNFDSLDALIAAIHNDIAEANKHLDEAACMKYAQDPFFKAPPSMAPSPSINTSSGATSAMNKSTHNNSILTSVNPDCSSFDKCRR